MKYNLIEWSTIVNTCEGAFPILLWYFTRHRARRFWVRYWKIVLCISMIVIFLTYMAFHGLLAWLNNDLHIPVWLFMVYTGLVVLIVHLTNWWRIKINTPKYYECHNLKWPLTGRNCGPANPPLCIKCDMEMMRASSMLDETLRILKWRCRNCGGTIKWDERIGGDMLKDVTARYDTSRRKNK